MFALFQSARKSLRLPILAPFIAMGLAACDTTALSGIANSGPSVDTSKPIAVALLVPRGSGSGSDDLLAQSIENAARLAMRDLGDVKN